MCGQTILWTCPFPLDMLTIIRVYVKMDHGCKCLNEPVIWNIFVL